MELCRNWPLNQDCFIGFLGNETVAVLLGSPKKLPYSVIVILGLKLSLFIGLSRLKPRSLTVTSFSNNSFRGDFIGAKFLLYCLNSFIWKLITFLFYLWIVTFF